MDQPMYKTKDGNFLSFEWDAKQNKFESEKAGRVVCDKVLMMRIISPAQQKSEVVYEVQRENKKEVIRRRDDLFQRYGEQIEAFIKGNETGDLQGTPIDEWPAIDVRTKTELKLNGVFTIEAMAELSDTGLQNIGHGGRELQKKAQAFIAVADGTAEPQKMAATIEKQAKEIEKLKKDIKEISEKAKSK